MLQPKRTFSETTKWKFILSISLLFTGILWNPLQVQATHLAGADLTYKRLTGNTYEFTISLIRDCDGVAAPSNVSLSLVSASCNINTSLTLNPVPGTGQEITFPCGNVQTECTGGTEPGYQQWVYKGTTTLSSCTDWVFSYQICCRNCDINTISHSANCSSDPGMYVEATLNNVAGTSNSSPSFTNLPVAFLCLNQNFNYNHGAIDQDGDSLVYSFVSPKMAFNQNVNFLPGYSATNFLTSSTPITINTVTGEVNFTPSNLTEVGITSIKVLEYRNGVLIGSVIRDFQFRVKDCYPNVIPTVSGINGTANTTAYACPGSQTCFNVLSNDSNAGQVVTMSWNNGIPAATFTTAGTPFPTGTFCWTPTTADIRPQPYTFTVTVLDNNCPINGFQNRSFSIYVTPPQPVITGDSLFCQGYTGTLNAGQGYVTYLWSTGATTQQISVTVSGTYTVTVSDANGCTGSASKPVATYNSPPCSITGGNFCSGTSTQLCAATNSAYLWSTSETTQCITVSTGGTYTVTVTNANGCTSSCSKTVTAYPLPSCQITGNASICQGSSTQWCAPSGLAAYLWSTGATTQCITVSQPGTYSVTVTSQDGCNSSCNKTLSHYQLPSCQITGSSAVCSGGSTQWCAPAGLAAYLWSTGATTQCITVSQAGSYTVTVTSQDGCTSSCSQTLTVNSNPTCSITGGNFCSGTSTQLCAATNSAYLWSTSETTQCITVSTGGTYTVTVTNANGCTSSCSKTVTAYPLPSCQITGNASICQGSSTQWCAPSGLAAYLWSTGATTQCITVSQPGTYSVTVTDPNGCTSSCNKTLSHYQLPSCQITGSSAVCSGGSTQWCAPAGLAAYLWSTGATTQCITVSQAGSYTVTVTSQDGCTSSCNKTLTVNPAGTSAITGSGSVCAGNSVQWCAPAGLASYLWSTGATTQCIVVSSAGTYSVTTTNGSGCISNSSKTLTVNPLPNCQLSGSTSICTGSSTSWCAPAGMASYLWSTGATTQCVTLSAAGTYSVTITNNKGCQSTCSKTLTLTQGGNSAITGSGSVCAGNSVQWCAPAGMASYLWSTGATTQCIVISSAGTYSVTTTNGSGCISNSSKTLTVNPLPNCQLTGSTSICTGSSTSWCAPAGMASYLWSTGATTQCVTLSAAGTYSVTITNNKGCQSTCSKTLTVTQGGNSSISGNASVCTGNSTIWCAPAGMASYLWSTGATTQCITVGTAGTYTVTTTNGIGCISSSSKTLTVKQLPVFQISGSTALCAGKTTTWCAPAGMASYSWSTGATTQCVTFGVAGTYTVTVTNNNGCTYSNSKTLVAWQNPTCSISGYTDICQGESTSLCGPQAAGNSFLWSTGATTRCISVSAVGPYTLTVYNQGGCSKSCQVNVTYKTPQSCCSGFRAHTNNEWGANPSGTNAGAYLQQHFAAAFPGPGYLTIGCTNLLRLTSAQAVNDFLPSFGPGGTLPAGTLTNPGATFSQTLAGHAVALTLNIKFDLTFANFGSSSTHLKDLYVASGPFTGMTVEQVLAEANNKLGGCGSSYSTTALTDVLASINSNFSDGFTNEGFLYCPFAVRPDLGFLSDQPAAGISARAYPNPFESTTTIEFRNSSSSANTRVELFNATGIRVAVLFEGSMAADELKRLTFHGEGFADGIYFYRISSDEQVFNGRLVLLRKE